MHTTSEAAVVGGDGPRGGRALTAADLAQRIRTARDAADSRRRSDELTTTSRSVDTLVDVAKAIARLRELDSTAELIENAAREACMSCGFTRVMLSRVDGAAWTPQSLYVTEDAPPNDAFAAFIADLEIPLTHKLVETDLVRRRMPMLVEQPSGHARTFKQLVRVSASNAYVAVPIMPTGRVIGLFHADRAGGARSVNHADLEHLEIFAESFGLVFEDAVLRSRLQRQRETLTAALTATARTVDEFCAEEIELARPADDGDVRAARRRAPRASPGGLDRLLTRREREVLDLMTTGATNREISQRLQVSSATVKSHTTRIFRKLRVTSRAEAAARLMRMTADDTANTLGQWPSAR